MSGINDPERTEVEFAVTSRQLERKLNGVNYLLVSVEIHQSICHIHMKFNERIPTIDTRESSRN